MVPRGRLELPIPKALVPKTNVYAFHHRGTSLLLFLQRAASQMSFEKGVNLRYLPLYRTRSLWPKPVRVLVTYLRRISNYCHYSHPLHYQPYIFGGLEGNLTPVCDFADHIPQQRTSPSIFNNLFYFNKLNDINGISKITGFYSIFWILASLFC